MTKRRVSWRDRLLVYVACACRAHMTTPMAYSFDLEAHERMRALLWRDAGGARAMTIEATARAGE